MSFRSFLGCSVLAFVCVTRVAAPAEAASVLNQTPQGFYTTNVLFGTSWSNFTTTMTGQHTITSTGAFDNLAFMLGFDALWVDQELDNSLSGSEISAIQAFIGSGRKAVLIGENDSWLNWNASLMSVVGGSYTPNCRFETGTPTSAHSLTNGITTAYNACGSTIDVAGSPEILFSNNMAALYQVGLGQALVILDSNWNDDVYRGQADNVVFAQNVVDWLGEPIVSTPEPTSLVLMGVALAGIAALARKRSN